MKFNAHRETSFKPITISITIESEEELRDLKEMTARTITISDALRNGSRYSGANAELASFAKDFLATFNSSIVKILRGE